MNIVFYDSSGEINRVVVAGSPENIAANTEGKTNYILTSSAVSALDKMVVDGEIVPRPVLGATITNRTITGVPSGAIVSVISRNIPEQKVTADGTDITLSPDIPGVYTVKVEKWPYQEEEFTIEYNG